jgi:hypothetical protein
MQTDKGGKLRRPTAQAALILLLPVVCLAIGGGLLYVRYVTLRDIVAARHWVATPCVIERAEYVRGSKGQRILHIEFTYQLGGATHRSDGLDLLPGSMGDDGPWEQELLARCRVGSQTTCFVDPQNAEHAVLDREHGTTGARNLRLLAFPFLFIGGAGAVLMVGSATATLFPRRRTRVPGTGNLLAPPRSLGAGQALALLLITPGDVKVAWGFFVGFAFVFTILGGPTALHDLWPHHANGATDTNEQLNQAESPSSARAERNYPPIWVSAIPLLVLALLALGIGGNYTFNASTLGVARWGDAVEARRVEKKPDDSIDHRPGNAAVFEHVFEANGASHRVDPRSHLSLESLGATVLYSPRNPKCNLGLNDSRKAILLGERNPWMAAVREAFVPGTCLVAIAWFLDWI